MGDSGWARMPKRISQQTLSATARELSRLLEAQCRGFAVVLHGGEPLLLGPDRLESTLQTLKHALSPECTLNLQTNGTLIDNSILEVCVRHGCTVSVSIDGPAPVHDRFRLDHQGRPTHSRVLRGIDKLKRHPMSASLFSGILAVIDPASEPEQVYEHLKSLGAPSIDLLYRDGNHSSRVGGWRASFKGPVAVPSLSLRASVRLPWPRFQSPAHQTGRADLSHPAFGRDHTFALGRPIVCRVRRVRPYSSYSRASGKCTNFPNRVLCFRQSH